MKTDNQLPTAEEFLIRQGCQRMDCEGENCNFFEDVQPKDLIEFTKLHVKAALKAASYNAEITNKAKFSDDYNPVVDEDSILNAYPLTNIK